MNDIAIDKEHLHYLEQVVGDVSDNRQGII